MGKYIGEHKTNKINFVGIHSVPIQIYGLDRGKFLTTRNGELYILVKTRIFLDALTTWLMWEQSPLSQPMPALVTRGQLFNTGLLKTLT